MKLRESMDDLYDLLEEMTLDFNNSSVAVALERFYLNEKIGDGEALHRNTGNLERTEMYMKRLAEIMDVGLQFSTGVHSDKYGEQDRILQYDSVRICR